MMAVQSDWGDPGFAGDYPALSTGTAPSAPGKRAKRTFNKQQHALQQLVADTVVLQPRSGADGPSNKPAHRTQGPTADSKQATGDAEETKKPASLNKKRKRRETGAAGSPDLQAPAAAAGANTGHAAAAQLTGNGTAASAVSEPLKPKRQRNKFKAHLAQGAVVPAAAGPNAAHIAAQVEAQHPAQPASEAPPSARVQKQRKGKQRPQQADAEAETRAAHGIKAQAEPADSTHEDTKPHSSMRSGPAAVADQDSAGARAADGSAKAGRKQRKADKQARTARAVSNAAAERPAHNAYGRPDAASEGAAVANGTAVQTEAVAETPSKKKRQLGAADTKTPASHSRDTNAHHAAGSQRSQEPFARHADGTKPVCSCDQRCRPCTETLHRKDPHFGHTLAPCAVPDPDLVPILNPIFRHA